MLIAMNEMHRTIFAFEEGARNLKKLYCPTCKQSVFLKKGALKVPHFSHYKKEACESFSEGETMEHLNGKLQLYTILKNYKLNVELEAYLPNLKQRPDILLNIEQRKIAIEFQCSQLPIQKMLERTRNYLKHGYQPYWILGDRFFKNTQMTQLKRSFIRFNPKCGLYLLHYKAEKNRLEIIHSFDKKANRIWNTEKTTISDRNLVQIFLDDFSFTERVSEKRVENFSLYHAHLNLQKQMAYSNPGIRNFASLLYSESESLMSMPIEVYYPLDNQWIVLTEPVEWKYRLLVWVEKHESHQIITEKRLFSYIEELRKQEKLLLSKMPLLQKDYFYQIFMSYMKILVEMKILRELRAKKWVILRPAKRFNNEDEKNLALIS
ncbi:competence protein CoiA [Marinilactibacillus sp. Marseille-P9653]|uniref:competence protein CoiA n=1 Tax=Marinilactibacillus sp. Marseille-P9653 TaxID=2866583 RepID=UPI001CE48808|nr:competence protein CoiA family protein [Marinilactibacillus sp. Marseille-P9653]